MEQEKIFFSAIGVDSHRFEPEGSKKNLILGGITIPEHRGLTGNSDADVILHALCNAISGLSGINILGKFTDKLCLEDGIMDSKVYVKKALDTLGDIKLTHISISIEALKPHLSKYIEPIRASIAQLVNLPKERIGLTATTGEGLTAFGKGEGIYTIVIASAYIISQRE